MGVGEGVVEAVEAAVVAAGRLEATAQLTAVATGFWEQRSSQIPFLTTACSRAICASL